MVEEDGNGPFLVNLSAVILRQRERERQRKKCIYQTKNMKDRKKGQVTAMLKGVETAHSF